MGATLRTAMLVWTVFAVMCAFSVYWGVRTHGHSPALIFVYVLLLWNGWALATPLVGWLGRRWPLVPLSPHAVAGHLAAALGLGALHILWATSLLVTMHPFDNMGAQRFGVALREALPDRLFLDAFIYVAVLGIWYAVGLRERERRAAQLEASLAQARLATLELQLQPHFLFNTLHTIAGLVRQERTTEAVAMIAGLSDLLRYSLDHAGGHAVPLGDELAIVGRYLEIQRLRFSDRLAVELDVPDDTRRALVPTLLLQPLAENAVRHGIEAAIAAGSISVRARREGDALVLIVANSGDIGHGSEGIGIANTRARLQQLFGARQSFALESSGGNVVATIRLPFEEAA